MYYVYNERVMYMTGGVSWKNGENIMRDVCTRRIVALLKYR